MTGTDLDAIEELRGTLRRLLRERSPLSSAHAAYDGDAGLDLDLWRRLAELGLTGLPVPEHLGGPAPEPSRSAWSCASSAACSPVSRT